LCEFRLQQNLLAVSVVDQLNDGLSAVYTFFDPQESRRGLGTYAIQRLISEACAKKLQWIYLGYWIDACTKMAYKSNFRPHQVFQHGRWRDPV
jgi:arginine-tRNA-protein transferase